MSTNLEKLQRLDNDATIQGYIAQADARYILLNTKEQVENFPNYTIQDDKLGLLAFYYLELGCRLFAQRENINDALNSIEKGASILEYVFAASQEKSQISRYYLLISALSYYLCFHYSKAFILIGKIQEETKLSKLLGFFLKKDYASLIREVIEIITDESYLDERIAQMDSKEEAERKIYEISTARVLNDFLRYFFTGERQVLANAIEKLETLKEISELKSEPDMWWVFRLLQLIGTGISEASIWQSAATYFDMQDPKVQAYVKSLAYLDTAVCELFITQRKSLAKALDKTTRGSVVTMPTSSGKTRIAEIAILDLKLAEPDAKVLYIAPFRSLAYEIEGSLDKILKRSGIEVSHLYGGNLFSKVDSELILESTVIIATPEKAKALLRSNEDFLEKIKLVILDEGHLLGESERLTRNETFYEELRFFIESNSGRFLLLSAVLPNAEELSKWLTGAEGNVFRETWRPSGERLGILEWDGSAVHLKWKNSDLERESFNRNFIVRQTIPPISGQGRSKKRPNSFNGAIARTAYELMSFGITLIFVGQKGSVFVMAKEYAECLNENEKAFEWGNSIEWQAFKLACIESYGEGIENSWLQYAKMGILCHHGGLVANVRIPLERLMRSGKPRLIVCTSTLGQGVNLGVSTVIFATTYQVRERISTNDFWNIAGRAGRAFVDHEGKILVSLNAKVGQENESWRINGNRNAINRYFDKTNLDSAHSGLLSLLCRLKAFATQKNISFEILLGLIAENQLDASEEDACQFEWIDDTLLTLHYENNHEEDGEENYAWIDEFFRGSLAYIQSSQFNNELPVQPQEILNFIDARTKGIVLKVGQNRNRWTSLIRSGMPLNTVLLMEGMLPTIRNYLGEYINSDRSISKKIELTRQIESTVKPLPLLIEYASINDEAFNKVRNVWLAGNSLTEIDELDDRIKTDIINGFYSFEFPWILSGISKMLLSRGFAEESGIIEELTILIEMGLPDFTSAKIYQSGIRSRSTAKELAILFEDRFSGLSIKAIRYFFLDEGECPIELISLEAMKWIEILRSTNPIKKAIVVRRINPFQTTFFPTSAKEMIVKQVNGEKYFISADFKTIKKANVGDTFNEVLNLNGISFVYNESENRWEMKNENPYIEVRG